MPDFTPSENSPIDLSKFTPEALMTIHAAGDVVRDGTSTSANELNDALANASRIKAEILNQLGSAGGDEAARLKAILGGLDGAISSSNVSFINQAALAAQSGAAAADAAGDVEEAREDTGEAQEAAEDYHYYEEQRTAAYDRMYSDIYRDDPQMQQFTHSAFAQEGLRRAERADPSVVAGAEAMAAIGAEAPHAAAEVHASMTESVHSVETVLQIHEDPDKVPEGPQRDYVNRLNASIDGLRTDLTTIQRYAPLAAQQLAENLQYGKYNEHSSDPKIPNGREALISDIDTLRQNVAHRLEQANHYADATMTPAERALLIQQGGDPTKPANAQALAQRHGLDAQQVLADYNSHGQHMDRMSAPQQAVLVEARRQAAGDSYMYVSAGREHLAHLIQEHKLSPEAVAEMQHMSPEKKVEAFKKLFNVDDPKNLPPGVQMFASTVQKNMSVADQAKMVDTMLASAADKNGDAKSTMAVLDKGLGIEEGEKGDNRAFTLMTSALQDYKKSTGKAYAEADSSKSRFDTADAHEKDSGTLPTQNLPGKPPTARQSVALA